MQDTFRPIPKLLMTLVLTAFTGLATAQLKTMRAQFAHPVGNNYKPGVYWYFMDGNMTAESMTKDLEAMKKAGIGSVTFLEVNVGVPRGPVDFLSDKWLALFAHMVKEAKRLGIAITLGIGPGWTGSGGPWVKASQSMQHLVASETTVSAGEDKSVILPVPQPKKPFFGDDGLPDEFKKARADFYRDVAVLAFPADGGGKISDYENKALYYRAPYSSGTVKPFIPPFKGVDNELVGLGSKYMIDLTGKMDADGKLNWRSAHGKWIVMRFGARNNGAITRPAPVPGLGFECDKFDTTALNAHLEAYVGRILKLIGPISAKDAGGLKTLHIDSWEMGAQNWTQNFRKEFIKRRGYDPVKYFPVYAGHIVNNAAESERFLWDMRQTTQELIIRNHAEHVKQYAHRHNLNLSLEPYDMNPTSDLELGSVADVPMAEFWSKGFGFNSTYSVIESTSVAHIGGKSLVQSEAFTAQDNEGWKQHPASMKNQGDWAFAAGVNKFVFHTFQNQFLPDSLRPGATMGPYGVHWDRNQTWWPMACSYHDYLTRSQYLLQQGRTVADILYLTPEGCPNVFVPPHSAVNGVDTIGDRRGYNFDGCAAGQLMRATVQNHRIVFPGGASYRVMVLPALATMTPKLLQKIEQLISAGAVVIGNPPVRSPGLVDYPHCDVVVKSLSNKIWGDAASPEKLTWKKYGQGTVINGGEVNKLDGELYPYHETVAGILKKMNIAEDFSADGPVRYTHRTSDDWDLYFVSNTSDKTIDFNAKFRTVTGSPEIWNAIDASIKPVHYFTRDGKVSTIPMQLQAHESCFVVFAKENQWKPLPGKPQVHNNTLAELNNNWNVSFDPKWGGPANVKFDELTDWTKNSNEGIKYYSGTAVYRKTFDVNELPGASSSNHIYLNLGKVKNMVRVTLNGKDLGIIWTAPWRVDITSILKKTANELKIEVINLWPNRLIGDEKKPDDGIKNDRWPEWLLKGQPRTSGRYTFTSTHQYEASSPLLESGLMGPVTVVQEVVK